MNRKLQNTLTLPGQVKVWSFNAWGDLYSPGEAGDSATLRRLIEIANQRNGGTGATLAGLATALRGCGLVESPRGWQTPAGWPPAVVSEIGRGI